jgi:RNA polymerase sigma-70 factor (ECF subfamily)
VCQETFLKIWNNLRNFKGESALSTWIYRIAYNESMQWLRKKKDLVSLDQILDSEGSLSGLVENGPYISGDQIQILLQKALLRLPEKQRQTFLYRYYDDLSYEEISGICGVSTGALKANYHHAVKKIETFFKSELNY